MIQFYRSSLLLIWTLLISFGMAQVEQDSFETVQGRWSLVQNEQKLIPALVNYSKELQDLIVNVKGFIASVSPSPMCTHCRGVNSTDSGFRNVTNLFTSLSLLTKLNGRLPKLLDQMESHKTSEMNLRKILDKYSKVGKSAMELNMESLIYLIIIYDIKLNDLESGHLMQNTNSGLAPQDFLMLGRFALKKQHYILSINFLRRGTYLLDEKLKLKRNLSENEMALKAQLNLELQKAVKVHDQKFDESNGTLPLLFSQKVTEILSPPQPNSTFTKPTDKNIFNEAPSFPEPLKTFSKLCKKPKTISKNVDRYSTTNNHHVVNYNSQKCYQFTKPHEFWLLQPLKIEVHSKDPFLIQFHDMLGQGHLENLQNEAASQKLVRSKVVSYNGDVQSDTSRVSFVSYIESAEGLARRVELMTGLKAVSEDDAEELQMISYTTGGHFLPHFDAIMAHDNPNEVMTEGDVERRGDRLATIIFYLSDTEQGGRTAFPSLGISVGPVKGSALMWFNLHDNGTIDRRTIHGGCGVVLGTKWIATKWIRSHGQMFVKKCDRKQSQFYYYDSYKLNH